MALALVWFLRWFFSPREVVEEPHSYGFVPRPSASATEERPLPA